MSSPRHSMHAVAAGARGDAASIAAKRCDPSRTVSGPGVPACSREDRRTATESNRVPSIKRFLLKDYADRLRAAAEAKQLRMAGPPDQVPVRMQRQDVCPCR